MKINRIFNFYIYAQLIICLFTGIISSYMSSLGVLFYLSDILNVICVITYIACFMHVFLEKKMKLSFDNIDIYILFIFVLYCFVSFAWSNYNFYEAITRLRYIFGAFLMYYTVRNKFGNKNYRIVVNLLSAVQLINLLLVINQNVVMGLHPDFCNGIFGFTGFSNGIQGLFSLAISILALIYYIEKKWCLFRSFFIIGVSCTICALAEIKLFFVIFVVCVLLTILLKMDNSEKRKKIILVLIAIITLLVLSYWILSIIMPQNLRVFENFDEAFRYEDRSNYAGRVNTIEFVYRRVFKSDFVYSLFGTGLGTSSSDYIYELGKLFSDEGFIGVVFIYIFLASLLLRFILSKKKNNTDTAELLFSGVFACAVAVSIIVWNSTFTKIVYIVFFFLGLFKSKYDDTPSEIKKIKNLLS